MDFATEIGCSVVPFRRFATVVAAAFLGMTPLPAIPLPAAPARVAVRPAVAPSPTTFSGRSIVVTGRVSGIPVTACDSGSLNPEGGAIDASLLTVNVKGVASGSAAHASVIGQGDRTRAEAGFHHFSVTALGTTVEAELMFSRSAAVCVNGAPSLSGNAEVSCVALNGKPLDITGGVNETFNLSLGKVVFNEQIKKVSGAFGELTVNAMHLVLCGGLVDVVISSAKAGITCGSIDCCCGDFTTGVGTIPSIDGRETACFVLAAGKKGDGTLWGSLCFTDRGAGGPDVKSTSVWTYSVESPTSRRIEGACTIDGVAGHWYSIHLEDLSSDGSKDTFMIDLSNGYWGMGTLIDGDLQIHVPCK